MRNEGALPLGPSSLIEGHFPKLFVHLGGLERKLWEAFPVCPRSCLKSINYLQCDLREALVA